MPKAKSSIQIKNRRASFDYEFLETYTAGIQLVGTEIKSIRAGKCSLQDAYCFFVGGELFVRGMNIAQYHWGSWGQHEPVRDRRLLLNRKELRHLFQADKQKGLTIVAVTGGVWGVLSPISRRLFGRQSIDWPVLAAMKRMRA